MYNVVGSERVSDGSKYSNIISLYTGEMSDDFLLHSRL